MHFFFSKPRAHFAASAITFFFGTMAENQLCSVATRWVCFFLGLFVVNTPRFIPWGEQLSTSILILLVTYRYVLYPKYFEPNADQSEYHRVVSEDEEAGVRNEEETNGGNEDALSAQHDDITGTDDEDEGYRGTSSNNNDEDQREDNVVVTENKDVKSDNNNSALPAHHGDNTSETERHEQFLERTEDDQNDGSNQNIVLSSPVIMRSSKIPFLNNVKTFLTFLVVTHHVTCAFGGCGRGSWFLIVGLEGTPYFDACSKAFTMLNQGYFMTLFFFISAYFVPSSYEKNGPREFFASRGKRLYIPALVVTMVLNPIVILFSLLVRNQEVVYAPVPGHCWFLFWLLLFQWIYSSFYEATKSTMVTPAQSNTTGTINATFPKTLKRIGYGAGVCGIGMLVIIIVEGSSTLASMPLAIGSFTCDVLMFATGIWAKRNGWLTAEEHNNNYNGYSGGTSSASFKSLKSQLDIRPWLLRSAVVLESVAMIILTSFDLSANLMLAVLFFIVAGIYCLDMNLAVLQTFQQYLNAENTFTNFLSRAAYTVYLIHPLVVVCVTAAYIFAFNSIAGHDSQIKFTDGSEVGTGGGDYFLVGWLVVNVFCHVIVWPLAWWLTQLPFLNKIL